MKYAHALFALSCVGLAACPSDPENAPTVWLAPDGVETRVRLVDHEPPRF